MKTLDEVIKSFESQALDGRDASRLAQFIPEERLYEIGVELKEEFVGTHIAVPWTRENILAQLEKDVAFGFEKALDKRGISSSLMYEVVCMWNDILEEGLQGRSGSDWCYAQYGLPTFKKTAMMYGFDNPIGNDDGDEYKYGADSDWYYGDDETSIS